MPRESQPCEPMAELAGSGDWRTSRRPRWQNVGVIRPGFSAELDGIRGGARGTPASGSPTWRRSSASAPASSRSRSATTRSSATTSRSRTPTRRGVPDDYIRKQTLVNAERYITPELKEYETLVLNAEERIREMETRLFREVCAQIAAPAAAAAAHGARAGASSTCSPRWPRWRRANRYVRPELADERRAATSAAGGTRWWSSCCSGEPLRAERRASSTPSERDARSSPGRTWRASPPTCGRWR